MLWPLPRYHTPGAPGFVSLETPDEVPWSQKADAAVWRGALAGLTQAKLMPDRAEPRLAYVLARELSEGGDAWPSLLGLSRHNLVHRTATSPDIDAKLVLGRGQSGLANHPRLAPYVDARRAPSFFHRYRYVLSLAGYDTGSNFLMAANTRSVVLKEEDGWELYYTPLFRPWEHYIPLEPGALDAEAKIDWARANPKQCQEISAAARASAARLAQRSTRRAMLAQILDVVRSGPLASPPDGG
ncbi:MAG: glycosyl transferase family 90 [Pseudomonadota bacterium]